MGQHGLLARATGSGSALSGLTARGAAGCCDGQRMAQLVAVVHPYQPLIFLGREAADAGTRDTLISHPRSFSCSHVTSETGRCRCILKSTGKARKT